LVSGVRRDGGTVEQPREEQPPRVEGRKKDSARLIWDTKPKRAPNPKDIDFQTAEIVIPNPHRDQPTLSSFLRGLSIADIDRARTNRLIWGDNLLAMQALLTSGYEEEISLIYIDPPFWTGENYYNNVKVGTEEVTTSPSVIERLAYKDIWEGGIDSYLDMLYPRLHLMKRLLSENGVIFVHTDWHMGHYVKIVCDEVFGRNNFRSEIVWQRITGHSDAKRFGMVHDTILEYSKSDEYTYVPQPRKRKEEYIESHFRQDPDGRLYRLDNATAAGPGPPRRFGDRVLNPPKGAHWRWSQERIDQLVKEGRIVTTSSGMPAVKWYLDEKPPPPAHSLWTDIPPVNPQAKERIDFPTQKPEELMERIINSSSKEGDLVADFFCGSGTTLAVAERLGRRWVGCDFSKVAIQMIRNRLVGMETHPFLLENIGNYQRHMVYLAGARIYEMQHIVLKLYGATPRKDLPELGTRKGDDGVTELVYVGYPDRAVTSKKVEELATQAETLDGTGYNRLVVLGWDYEYNYEELLADRIRIPAMRKSKIEIVNRTIPPEVYEYLRTHTSSDDVESFSGKVRFYDKPYLKLAKPTRERSGGKAKVTVGIERYVFFPGSLPIENEEQKREVEEIYRKSFAAILDYWAVDWDYEPPTFRSTWQAFRGFGKNIKQVPISVTHELSTGKKYLIAVKAVDVFGNDATATCSVDLR
jgi:adenine-specific DNA-methyltransferase